MEIAPQQRAIRITDSSQPSEARRVALGFSDELQFNETRRGEAGIIVTEAARNILLHGRGGEIVLSAWNGDCKVLDVLALDKGPGMKNPAECMRDGYSTAGTSGTGLGAIARMASLLEVQTQDQSGTALLARLGEGSALSRYFEVGAISIPVAGEQECGDSWAVHHGPGRSVFMVADGLGHGVAAAEASQEAVRIFHESVHLGPQEMLARIHDALKKTRGAAVAITEISTATGAIRYSGVGNISAAVISGDKTRSMVSHNGTLGHTEGRVQEFQYPWPERALLVMHSDGLSARWNLDRYPGLAAKHPQLIAGVLYRDFRRERDDATVLVAREVPHA